MPDLVVIGAGLSGLTAALTAVQAGLSARVIAKGMGALHWSAGTIDLFGYAMSGEPIERPLTEVDRAAPPHPYAMLGSDRVRDALTWFSAEASAGGSDYNGASLSDTLTDANLWLPSPAGAMRPTYLAPAAQRPGDLASDAPMLIVGLQGMRDFYPELIAANLQTQGITARAAHIPVSVVTERVDFNTVHLAHALDDLQAIQRLAQELAKHVRAGERIGLPAVVGLDRHADAIRALREAVGAAVFEISTLPPSVPGIRLHRALHSRLAVLGVRIETGMEVIGFGAESDEIRWVETETSARPLRHRADRFLLATGGVLGGGFSADAAGRFTEDVFGLPLTKPPDHSAWFRPTFLDERGQPIFHAGVEVNESHQPIDDSGRTIYTNLWAAGGVLAHADPIRERSLEGLAIATGRAAALALVAHAGVVVLAT